MYLLCINHYFMHNKILWIFFSCTWKATFSFSTGPMRYHVFCAAVGGAPRRCNRHQISTADYRYGGSRLTPAIIGSSYVMARGRRHKITHFPLIIIKHHIKQPKSGIIQHIGWANDRGLYIVTSFFIDRAQNPEWSLHIIAQFHVEFQMIRNTIKKLS